MYEINIILNDFLTIDFQMEVITNPGHLGQCVVNHVGSVPKPEQENVWVSVVNPLVKLENVVQVVEHTAVLVRNRIIILSLLLI